MRWTLTIKDQTYGTDTHGYGALVGPVNRVT